MIKKHSPCRKEGGERYKAAPSQKPLFHLLSGRASIPVNSLSPQSIEQQATFLRVANGRQATVQGQSRPQTFSRTTECDGGRVRETSIKSPRPEGSQASPTGEARRPAGRGRSPHPVKAIPSEHPPVERSIGPVECARLGQASLAADWDEVRRRLSGSDNDLTRGHPIKAIQSGSCAGESGA